MSTLGTLALALALGAALFTAISGIAAGRMRSLRLAEASRYGLYIQAGLIAVAAAALWYGFASHDFSLKYVYGRSAARMPAMYVFTAFWGGQEGSLLFWTLLSSGFAAAAAFVNRDRLADVMPWFHAVSSLMIMALLGILNFVTPPFAEFFIADAPIDGQGLNPLLQTPLMAIHPPMLLAGFATFLVPWAFAMAAVLAGRTGSEWLKASRRWTLLSWLFLSLGNILGGMWAYRELGWGGYWAWDPVENAALIPWFTASAYLHSVIIQEQRGMLRRWNVVLVTLTYLLTLLGTWMTRSGLIESVHTFAESDIGVYFLALFLFGTAISVLVIATHWKALKSPARMDSVASREGAFLLNNWVLVGLAFVVLWGTLFPKFKEMATGDAISIGPTWFNRTTAPLDLVLLALMMLGTLLPWRRVTLRALRRNFVTPTGIALIIAPLTAWGWWMWRGEPLGVDPFKTTVALSLICWLLVVMNTATVVNEYIRGARARLSKHPDDPIGAFLSLFTKHRRRYGGYLVHLGILMIFLAFTGNALKADADATLRVGESIEVGDYTITFDGLDTRQRPDRIETIAAMTVERNGRVVGELLPSRFDYNDYARLTGRPDPMKITSEIFIRSTPVEDVYVALLNHDPTTQAAAFKLTVLPFTWWLWFGGLVLIAGTLVCFWPDDDRLKRAYWQARAARRAEQVLLALFVIGPAVFGFGRMNAFADETHPDHGHEDPAPIELTAEQRAVADEAFALIMTTCSGCAGKTLSTASPSCYPSNEDKARIRDLARAGEDLDGILAVFVAERGEASLAVPPREGFNRLAWLVPFAGVGFTVFALGAVAKRWAAEGDAEATAAASEEDADGEILDGLRDELAALE